MSEAVKGGDPRILEYLYKIGCPLNGQAYLNAVKRRDLYMLSWLKSRGCQWDDQSFLAAIRNCFNAEMLDAIIKDYSPHYTVKIVSHVLGSLLCTDYDWNLDDCMRKTYI